MPLSVDVQLLERGELDPRTFRHADHVRLAFEMLSESGFIDALPRYAGGIRKMAEKAGKPEAYNETITTAFLALISERMAILGNVCFDGFRKCNPDLLSKDCLSRFYSVERLTSPMARRTFLLPDQA